MHEMRGISDMNDFTKEELQIIHLDMTTYIRINRILTESPSHKSLRDKIESMIDDYCEHECNGEVEIFIDTCCKCKAYLLREAYHDN